MKKIASVILLAAIFLISLASCTLSGGSEAPSEISAACDTLARLRDMSYSEISLKVTTVTDGTELNASYVVTEDLVEWSAEQLSLIPEDGTAAPDEFITTLSGTATVKDGRVESISGDPFVAVTGSLTAGGFVFNEANLADYTLSDGVLEAKIISPKAFLLTDAAIGDMTLRAEYSDNALKVITVCYKLGGSSVTARYEFTL